jgi:hypothetical protein
MLVPSYLIRVCGKYRVMFFQPTKSLLKNLSGSDVGEHGNPVVYPLPVSTRSGDAGTAQIREVTRNLWLRFIQNLNKVADTNFPDRP